MFSVLLGIYLGVHLIFFWLLSLKIFVDHETIDPVLLLPSGSEMLPLSVSPTAPAQSCPWGSVGPTLELREGRHGQWLCAVPESWAVATTRHGWALMILLAWTFLDSCSWRIRTKWTNLAFQAISSVISLSKLPGEGGGADLLRLTDRTQASWPPWLCSQWFPHLQHLTSILSSKPSSRPTSFMRPSQKAEHIRSAQPFRIWGALSRCNHRHGSIVPHLTLCSTHFPWQDPPVVKSTCISVSQTREWIPVSLLLAELSLASYLTFLSLIFLTCKMEKIMVTTIKDCCKYWS